VGGMIHLRPITDENRADVLALRVSPAQEQFVSSVAESLQEAADEPGGRAVQRAVYDDETPVGFVMWSEDVDEPGFIPHYLWKLLIDERHQRRGHGTIVVDLVAKRFRERGAAVMSTSAGQGDGSPIPFYERCGFVRTGDIVFDDEVLLELRLR
jgi:GNAT superfamily N-acetyltransferase